MQAGRKPKPTAMKLVSGNPGRRELNADEPRLDLSQPSPPPFLSDDAKVEWGRLVGALFQAGLMTEADRGALAAYCQAYGRWAQAERSLAAMADRDPINHGLMIKTSNGNAIQNPLVGIANKAYADVVKIAAEFGMTPSARSRVTARPPAKGGKFSGNGKRGA